MYRDVCGIYKITNIVNKKVYIGGSSRCKARISDHKRFLRLNIHSNCHLQSSYNKYGFASFKFEIIQICLQKELDKYELEWCDRLDCHNRLQGYNIKQIEGSHRLMSKESRLKLRKANLGKKMTEASKKKLREINLGKKMPSYCMPKIIATNIKKRKPVIQYDLMGNELRRFVSAAEAFKSLGGRKTVAMRRCKPFAKAYNCANLTRTLKGRSKTFCGFKWKYA